METSRRKRIGVLVGGEAPERELSVQSGEAVLGVLRDAGCDAVPLFVDRDLDLLLRQERIEIAFLSLRGRTAAGPVQGLLETLGIPYTGSSLAASALAADKLKAKEQFRLHNLPTPAYYRHARGMGNAVEQHHAFGFPCVVKPRGGGSGIGVALVHDEDQLAAAVEVALRIDDEVLIERHLSGVEVQVAIVDGQVLGAAEVVAGTAAAGLFDHGARLAAARSQVFIPPRLGVERLRGVLTQALRAHHLLGCEGATRVDLVVEARGNEQILEVDAAPELAPGALLPKIAHAARLSFPDLVTRILDGARLHANRRMRERRELQLPITTGDFRDRRAGGASERH